MKAVAVVSRLFVLLASAAQAFQLQSHHNNHHHLVSLIHPDHQTLDTNNNNIININPATSTKQNNKVANYYYNSDNYSPQTAATQINRTVNRNTKNRQNQSKCLFDAPHSTLLQIVDTSPPHHHHRNGIIHGNDNNNNKKKSIQQSLRQLGIAIASTFLLVTRAHVKVANAAAAAATPLIVTHPTGIGSTAITPLLSTASSTTSSSTYYYLASYQGLTLIPTSFLNGVGGLSPAIGEIVMSFAYMTIALGISHWLGRVAEGGHVKLLKLMAWQNFMEDDVVVVDVSSSSSKSSSAAAAVTKSSSAASVTKSSSAATAAVTTKSGGGIQGFISRYTYMIQLIFREITKAYRMRQPTPATTTTPIMATAPTPIMVTAPPFAMNWKEYSNLLQQKNNKKVKNNKKQMSSQRWSRVVRNGGELVYNKFAMMFERIVKKSDLEAEETKKATDLYQQKQFEQHHHHVHVPRSRIEESSYLNSLTKFGTGEVEELYKQRQRQGQGGTTKGYLDTLSDDEATTKSSTWGVYKDQVEKAQKEMKHEDEVDYLREELIHVQNLLQDEQSMYQTSYQALNLVVEAQNEELKHVRTSAAAATTAKDSTMEELKEFDIKAKEYDETMKESKENEVKSKEEGSTAPHKWIF